MDHVTQQNSALVEENAATAKLLEQQAKSMDEQVAFFQIGDAANVPAMPRAERPADMVKAGPKPSAKPARAARAAREEPADAATNMAPAAAKQQPVVMLKRSAAKGAGGRQQAAAVKDDDWAEF